MVENEILRVESKLPAGDDDEVLLIMRCGWKIRSNGEARPVKVWQYV